MDLKKLHITKPFANFKWRWMELTPVESFNRQDVFLGITRALYSSSGKRASDSHFLDKLKVIQNDLLTGTRIELNPSDPQRNVVRRQGRYWRGLGVLDQSAREIRLTNLGRDLADGTITTDQFVLNRIYSHSLPNLLIDSAETIDEWKSNGIEIKPLKLILDILVELVKSENIIEAYLTPEELIKVVIPMSAQINILEITDFSAAVLQFRQNPSVVSHFPDCVLRANDKRMAREHLLFLKGFDVLEMTEDLSISGNYQRERYFLGEIGLAITSSTAPAPQASHIPSAPTKLSAPEIGTAPDIDLGAVRAKKITSVMTRPNQAKFRRLILGNFASKCIVTGENTPDVLDACHIISVSDGGHDSVENGICLRSDLHKLFDNGKLRISDTGQVTISPDLSTSPTYKDISRKISLPENVSKELLRRKWSYGRTGL